MSVRATIVEGYRGALPTLLVSALGGLLAGGILGGMEAELAAVPGLLVVVPAFLAIRGSVYGSLGARLSSALHQGLIEPRFAPTDRLVSAAVAALLNGLAASLVAATLAFAILVALGRRVAPLWTLALIALVGGALAGVVLIAVIVVVVFGGYRRGMNPDNLVGPAVTTAGDIFGMAALYVATRFALALV
ncbi:magnesium transporter [Halosimplex amylolyticum]|uniref:magnesium transporter n=1 Tax=Halosimplex amylolyticum TaxID=3396616 RepID=UPI003F5724AC